MAYVINSESTNIFPTSLTKSLLGFRRNIYLYINMQCIRRNLSKPKNPHNRRTSYTVCMMVNFISLSDLNNKIPFPAIRVKIIRKWSTKIGRDHHSVMLLGDAQVSILII